MPSGGGSDYMLKVGADFSGVIQELSKVESFAKSTEGGLLAPPTSGAKPFATVTEGTRYSGRTVAVSEVAREQAERIAIQMQDGILRSVKANEMQWSKAREFKPDDAKLKEIGTAYASKLRLAGEEMQSFVASFTSQVQAMFGPKSVWASKVIGTSSGGVRKNLDTHAIEAFQGSAKAFERERKAYLTSAEKRTNPAADERISQQKDRVGRALIAALEEEVRASHSNLSTAKKFDIIRRRAILALQGEDFKGYRASVSKALTEASRGLDDTLDITSADIGPSRVSKMSKKNLDLEVQANADRAIADMNKGLIAVDELGLYLQSMARPKSNWGRQQYEQASKVQMASLIEIPRSGNEGRDPSDVFDAEEAAALKLQQAQQEAAALMELVIYHLTDYVEALSQRVFLESAINTEVQKQMAISPLITETLAEEARQKMLVANAVASNKLADPLYLTASSDQGLLKRQQEAASKLAGLRSSTEPDIASRAASLEQRSLAISGDILKSGEITADIRNRINSLLNDSMGLIQADNAIQRQIAASDTFAKEAAIRNANIAAERASLGAIGKAAYAMSTPVVGDIAQGLHQSGGRRALGLDPSLEVEAYKIYIEQLKADLKSSVATRTGIKKIDDELYIAKQNELKVAETSLASIKAAVKRQDAALASRGGDRSLRPDIVAATATDLNMKAAKKVQADLDAISASPAISRGSVAGISNLADLERDQYLTMLEKRKLQESIGDGTIRSEAETEALEERLRAATQRLVELKEHSGTLAQRAISEDVASQRAVANMQARLQATNVPFDVGVASSKLNAAYRGIGKIGFDEDGERLDAERKRLMERLVGATSVDKETQDRITALNAEIEYILEKRKSLESINLANYGTMPVDKRLRTRGMELERLAATSPAHSEAKRRIEMGDRSPFYSEEFGQYSRMSQEALSVEGKILAAQLKRLQYLEDITADEAAQRVIGKQIFEVQQQQAALNTTKAALSRNEFVDTNALQAYRQTALNRIAAGAVTPPSGAELSAVEEKAVMQQIVAVLSQQLNDETISASLTKDQIKAKSEMVMAAQAAAEAATKAARTEKENALIADQQRMLGKTPYQKIAAERASLRAIGKAAYALEAPVVGGAAKKLIDTAGERASIGALSKAEAIRAYEIYVSNLKAQLNASTATRTGEAQVDDQIYRAKLEELSLAERDLASLRSAVKRNEAARASRGGDRADRPDIAAARRALLASQDLAEITATPAASRTPVSEIASFAALDRDQKLTILEKGRVDLALQDKKNRTEAEIASLLEEQEALAGRLLSIGKQRETLNARYLATSVAGRDVVAQRSLASLQAKAVSDVDLQSVDAYGKLIQAQKGLQSLGANPLTVRLERERRDIASRLVDGAELDNLTQDRINSLSAEIAIELEKRKIATSSANKIATADLRTSQAAAVKNAERGAELEYLGYNNPYHAEAKSRIALGEKPTFYSEEFGQYSRMSQEEMEFESQVLAAQKERLRHLQATSQSEEEQLAIDAQITAVKQQEKALLDTRNALLKGEFVDTNLLQSYRQTALARIGAGAVTPALGVGLSAEGERAVMQQIISVLNGQLNDETVLASLTEAQVRSKEQMLQAARAALENTKRVANAEAANALLEDRKRALGETHAEEIAAQRGVKPTPTSPEFSVSTLLQEQEILKAQLAPLKREFDSLPKGDTRRDALGKDIALIDGAIAESKRHISASVARELEARRSIEAMTEAEYAATALVANQAIESGQIPAGLSSTEHSQLMAVVEQEVIAEIARLQNIEDSVVATESINALENQHRALLTMSNDMLKREAAANSTSTMARMRNAGGAGGFFAGGLMSTIRYGLPSMALFGAFSGFKNLIKESEELQYNMAILEDQFKAVFSDTDFSPVRGQITALARETGLQADEIAKLRIQITGAFSAQSIKGMGGPTLVEEQTEAAAKMAQTLKIPLAEINDGLQAASLNFHVLYEDIGDVATALEQRSGVLAKEIVSFVGDTAPVFKEAGFSMQETAAIAAVSAQRSGRSGTAIAEAFGRVIPALTENADKLRELAAMEPSLATPKFLDALRTSNVKDIFDEVGGAYNQMSVEGKQALVQALGGRREAQVILPALTNRALIEEYTKAADDSAGTLEERFKRIQGTLTNAMQRLGEYIKTLGVDLMDAGLEDVFSGAIDAVKILVSTLSPLLKAVTAINDMFGKWPIRILATVGAFKAFNALMMVGDKHILASGINRLLFGKGLDGAVAVNSLRGAFTKVADAGQAGGLMRALSERKALARTVWNTGLVPLERGGTSWGAPTKFASGTKGQRPLAMGKLLLPGGLGTNAAAAESAIAGSSALVLGGIAVLAATAMAIKGAQDKNQKAWEDLKSKVDADLGSRNLDAPDVRKQAIEDMQHQADSLKKSWDSRSNLVKAWDTITAKSPDWEVYSMKARSLGVDEETSKMRSAISSSSILREKLMKMFNEEYGLAEDAFKGESTWSTLWGGQKVRMGGGTQIRTLGSRRNVDAVKKISDAMGFGYKMVDNELVFDMDKDVLKALGSEDPQAELQKLADGGDDVREGAQRQALTIMKATEKLGKTDAEFNEMVAELEGLRDKLPPADQAKADLQDLQKMLDLGLITADQYTAQAASRLNTLNALASRGTQEETTKDLISTAEQTQAAYKAITDHITAQQTSMVDVYTTLGYSENATQNMAALYAVANLRDPKFRDPAARLEAAKTIIEVQRRTDMELAIKANDQARINELLTEGAEMSPEVKKVMFRNLFAQSGGEQSFINALNEGLQYAPKVPSKDYISGDASKLLDDWLFEYQQFGKISDKSFGDIKTILNGMMSARSGLDADALAQIDDGAKWIIQMLAYSGMSREEILSALKPGSRPSTRAKFEDLIDQAFSGDNEFNKIQEQIKNMKILGGVEEFMKVIEADAELKKSLLKGSSVGAALIEANVAQQRLDLLRQARASDTDIMKAQAEVNNANQKVKEAMKGVADSESQLRITLLRNAGDTVGAARAEVEQAKRDLEWAKSNNVDAVPGLQADLDTKLRGESQAKLAKRSSLRDLAKTRAEINGDAIAAAEIAVQDAQDARNEARGDEIPAAQARLEQAQEEQRKARIAVQDAWFSLQSTMLTDPVEQAQAALVQAQQHLADARGDQAKLEAYGRVVESQRALNDAMASVRQSYYTLRQAELQAMGDDVGAAEVAAQAARDQLLEAVKNKKGDTEIRNLRAQVVTADKAAKDALFDEKMYDYKWMMDMGQITKSQYADYLEGLKSTLIPGTRQFKDLELTIKQLRDDIGSDLQHNLPTSLALPTLYEVRRLNQMQGSSMSAAMGGGIGYQDNRTQDIVVYVSNGMGAEEVVGVLQDALDGSRSGSGPRRY